VAAGVEPGHAGIVLSFLPQSSTITLPASGTTQFSIEVQMASDAGVEPILGYTIPVDLQQPAGTDAPAGWNVVSVTPIFDFPDNPFVADLNPSEGDLLAADANSASGSIDFTTTPVSLFSFTVEIDSTAVAGDYQATIVDDILLSIDDESMNPLPSSELTLQVGNITLRAIPEPASGMFAAVVASLVCVRYRRRKSQSGP
jgi:hypothetical protein